MIEVSFVYNNYAVKVAGEDADRVEMDIVEIKTKLHQMPPAVSPIQANVHPSPVVGAVPAVGAEVGISASSPEIIPVTKITEEKTRNGSKKYKIIGGKYDAYGVALYPDTCIFQDGLVSTMIMNEVVSGLEALIVTQDGTKRVAALRRKQASV